MADDDGNRLGATSSGAAREEILGRIRQALAGQPADQRGSHRPIPRDYHHSRDYGAPGEVLALAAERIADYRAVVRRLPAAEVTGRISAVVTERGLRTLAAPADLPTEWCVAGPDWRFDDPPLSVPDLDSVDGVVTGCAVTIAETGTIVLDGGAAQGRRALTLVPDYHLCVVRAGQVVGSVPEAIARLAPTRPITFISGPSATSDIELDRVEGVHGPRTLEVLLLE